jgi:integrase/recombinase XerD
MHTTSHMYEHDNIELDKDKALPENSNPVEEYLTWKRSYALPAFRSYKIWVERFHAFIGKSPEMLSHMDYAAFAEHLRLKYSPKCVEFALTVIHNYLRFFSEQHRLRFPLYLVRVPKAMARSHHAVTEEEYHKMVLALQSRKRASARDLAILMLLHDTGMRVGEVCSLEIDDIEPDCSAVIRTEKTTRRRRVFWNANTDLVLQRYLVERINSKPKTEMLFVALSDGREQGLKSRSIQRMVGETTKRAGIKANVCPHSFRHAFIHRLAKLGVPDALIAQLVGHSSPISIAHYTKLSRPEFEEVGRRQLSMMHAGLGTNA